VPGLTLENLVVSEDPAFGYEPTIRANTVEVTLRPASLWRRQVEFSSIRFVEPSLNLVRNAQGQWNLESLLMHAASVDAAPTAQSKPGPAPRFPYIEARNGRVNIKMGQQKQPFSLTEADFALWLPSPQQWNLRVEARPVRTDSNVNDAGTVRLEGSLDRAAERNDAGINLQASWHDAPLGEASSLLTGADAGWRGHLNIDATLIGTLRRAEVTVVAHLNDLRRADFVPPRLLDINVRCTSLADVPQAEMTQLDCSLPLDAATDVAKTVRFTAATLDLVGLHQTASTLSLQGLPLPTVLDWARLFSRRIPADLNPTGTVDGKLDWSAAPQPGWSGGLTATLTPAQKQSDAAHTATATPLLFVMSVPHAPNPELLLQLQPVGLHPAGAQAAPAALTLSGLLRTDGYMLHLAGSAAPAQIVQLSGVLPPFSDGVAQALPHPEATLPTAVDLTCTRQWPTTQSCTAAPVATTPRKRRPARLHS
jgi:AsmA protein